MNDLYFTAKIKKGLQGRKPSCKPTFFCYKTYEKGQNTPILAIKNHNTDILRINIMVSLCLNDIKKMPRIFLRTDSNNC